MQVLCVVGEGGRGTRRHDVGLRGRAGTWHHPEVAFKQRPEAKGEAGRGQGG